MAHFFCHLPQLFTQRWTALIAHEGTCCAGRLSVWVGGLRVSPRGGVVWGWLFGVFALRTPRARVGKSLHGGWVSFSPDGAPGPLPLVSRPGGRGHLVSSQPPAVRSAPPEPRAAPLAPLHVFGYPPGARLPRGVSAVCFGFGEFFAFLWFFRWLLGLLFLGGFTPLFGGLRLGLRRRGPWVACFSNACPLMPIM